MKKIIIMLFVAVTIINLCSLAIAEVENKGIELLAEVIEVEDYEIEDADGIISGQKIKIKILTDDVFKDREYTLENEFQGEYYKQAGRLKKGNRINIIMYFSEEGRVDDFYILSQVKYYHAIWLGAVFFILLILVGKKKGLKSAVSLLLTLLVVIFIMIPLLKKGYSPVPITILSCLAITIITLLIIGGISSKSVSAILGTVGGLIIAWGLSALAANLANMTSLATEEVEMLIFNDSDVVYNLKGILLSGIIIGCLGAVMDVAMTISSTINQLKSANTELSKKNLYKAGMDVGCDIIGTMSNTLILAYTGSALTMILVQSTYGFAISDLLNHDFILEEVIRSLTGSIGMILTVPFTAFIASRLAK